MDFDWNNANIEHIALHGIDPEDAEEAVLDESAIDFSAHRGPQANSDLA